MKIVEKYIKILTNKNYSKRTIETYSFYLQRFLNSVDENPYHISTKTIELYLVKVTLKHFRGGLSTWLKITILTLC